MNKSLYAIFKKCIFKCPRQLLVAITLQLCAFSQFCLGQDKAKETPQLSPVIYATANQELLSLENLVNRINQAHVTILGELHDNPYHHELRANLLRQLPKRSVTVIAEHLSAKKTVQWNLNLEEDLKNAGFDLKAWQWPLHRPLFNAIAELQLPLLGGNLPPSAGKEIFAHQDANLPPTIRQMLQLAKLSENAENTLFQAIQDGHCNLFPKASLPKMSLVQRARDAYMALELIEHQPAILLSGNGHAWKDIGVPQIIKANQPTMQLISVLLIESPDFKDLSALQEVLSSLKHKADYVWFTPVSQRADPCAALQKRMSISAF